MRYRNKNKLMTDYDKEFEERNTKILAFKSELKSIRDKYNFGVTSINEFDGQDDFSHINFHFVVNGETWYGETIEDILHECLHF